MSYPICRKPTPKVDADPGTQLDLTAVLAPNEAAAAMYYPAIYWYSMRKMPDPCGAHGTRGNRDGRCRG
jgi:hypothetical protein